jgi:hypothetical protein
MCHAINVQIVGNDKKLILDINADWQGVTHDARIWNNSAVKRVIHRQRRYLLAGDSAYPISDVVITPYRNVEAVADPTMRDFNQRLSGLRTVMSENIFGIWKRRFPCLKYLRCHYPRARKVVIATAILHNISIIWNDEDPVGNVNSDAGEPFPEVHDEEDFEIIEDDAEPPVVRARGQTLRDHLRLSMSRRRWH